ncbi:hypothetical protein E4U55_007723 [Claviceps digitariae]|nr:hypothetical protein E4U55_007723 [Claviceps digitariae]
MYWPTSTTLATVALVFAGQTFGQDAPRCGQGSISGSIYNQHGAGQCDAQPDNIWVCGDKLTTVNIDSDSFLLSAPLVDSDVWLVCGINAYPYHCTAGGQQSFPLPCSGYIYVNSIIER